MPTLHLNKVAKYWEEVININEWQKDRISKLIVTSLFGTVSEKIIYLRILF